MPLTNQLKNQHLLWRAAFGPMAENINELEHISQKELYKLLVKTSSKKPDRIFVTNNTFDGLVKGIGVLGKMENPSPEQRKQIRRQSVSDLKDLNLTWLDEMIHSEAQLREKMSLFWHGHFACRVVNIYFQQQLLHSIRENALGNFGELLREVSKSPAMLSFLNNQQNRKQHPNENFARELMELFTMGRGNYTETDIKEAARAFTGWGFTSKGEFVDRKIVHDNGQKTFLGKTGNFDGDDIIDIILEQKATAKFITEKIYRFYVNEELVPDQINKLAASFYQSNYDLQKLMEDIFTADWFYDKKNIGTRIKSPIELLAGIRRLIPMDLDNPEIQLLFQRTLGQLLFYPPNVAGWPGGKSWIDSSTLMLRMRLPQILTHSEEFAINPKDDDDVMMGNNSGANNMKKFMVPVQIDWPGVIKPFKNIAREHLMERAGKMVLQTQSSIPATILNRFVDDKSREVYIKTLIVQLMSTPQYQLC